MLQNVYFILILQLWSGVWWWASLPAGCLCLCVCRRVGLLGNSASDVHKCFVHATYGLARSFSGGVAICYVFPVFTDDVISVRNESCGVVSMPLQLLCRITPLLRRIGYVMSWTPRWNRVHRVRGPGAEPAIACTTALLRTCERLQSKPQPTSWPGSEWWFSVKLAVYIVAQKIPDHYCTFLNNFNKY